MFKINQLVVYPAHGLARVKKIETKIINESPINFYIITILDSGMTVLCPVNGDTGLRALVNSEQADMVLTVLGTKTMVDNTSWNRRYREYLEHIKSGSLLEIAGILRDLHYLRSKGDLSFGERKMFDQAFRLLTGELSAALSIDIELVEDKVKNTLDHVA